MPPQTALLQAIVTGIATGSMVALGAIGLSMVYSIAEVPNFAHGDLLTLGAYIALVVNLPGNVPLLNIFTTGSQSLTLAGMVVVFLLGAAGVLGAVAALGGRDALYGSWWPTDPPPQLALGVHLAVAAAVGLVSAWGIPSILAAMVFSGAVVAGIAPLFERYIYGKFREKGVSIAMMLVVSLAAAYVLRFSIQTVFGATTRSYQVQSTATLFGVPVEVVRVKFIDFYVASQGLFLRVSEPTATASTELSAIAFSWPLLVGTLVVALGAGYAGYRYRLGKRAVLGPYLLGTLLAIGTFVVLNGVLAGGGSVPEGASGTRVKLSVLRAFIILLALLMMGFLHTVLRATTMGKAMRATSDNRELAQVRGINTERVTMGVWVIAGMFAGVAGVVLGQLFGTLTIPMGFYILLPMFAAVILGGITIYGALLGSYVVGLSMEIGIFAIPGLSATYRVPIAFVVLILVLLVKPEGITN